MHNKNNETRLLSKLRVKISCAWTHITIKILTMRSVHADYQIAEKLNEGVNSLVYRACRDQDDFPIVIKILKQDYPSPEELSYFRREYELTNSLDLPGVIHVYKLEKVENTLLMEMEDCGGRSLDLWLQDGSLSNTINILHPWVRQQVQ